MVKAVFIDFYGTVVYEDGEIINKISQVLYETGNAASVADIGKYWWNRFKTLFENAYGENFRTQRELEIQSLSDTIKHFSSTADAVALSNEMFEYWMNPPVFEESREFFEKCPVPVYIVSNIDRNDLQKAIEFHGLKPSGIFTSEDAKAYKPRKELFELTLASTGLQPEQVLHIGDSLSSDVEGARAVGINAIWVNRSRKEIPKGVVSITHLLEVFDFLTYKIQELNPDMVYKYIDFFENRAFSDGNMNKGCYCVWHHWTERHEYERSQLPIEERPLCKKNYAIELIKHNRLHGFVAYYSDEIVGFCNADWKENYFRFSKESFPGSWNGTDERDKILALVCFTVAPEHRGRGIAKKMLEYACDFAKRNGYDYIESYPPDGEFSPHNCCGNRSMYEGQGFEIINIDGGIIARKKILNFDNHDERIRHYELLLKRDLEQIPHYELPEGYKFVMYKEGDRDNWIEIEKSAKEFVSYEQGLQSWNQYYETRQEELPERMVFIENSKGEKIATATAFYNIYREDPSGAGWLHWVAIRREDQGKGLSKPLITYVMEIMRRLGYRHAKIPTQTTTWLACKVYMDLGFEPVPENKINSREGWRIVKTLTDHPVLCDLEEVTVDEILDCH